MQQTEEQQLQPTLRLLEALVISQGPAFFGSESLVLYTLLNMPTSASNGSSIAAIEGISESFCDQLEPLYGLAAVRSAMGRRLVADESEAEQKGEDGRSGVALGMTMRMMGNFFKRLPKEVLEDEIPKVAHILRLVRFPLHQSREIDSKMAMVIGVEKFVDWDPAIHYFCSRNCPWNHRGRSQIIQFVGRGHRGGFISYGSNEFIGLLFLEIKVISLSRDES